MSAAPQSLEILREDAIANAVATGETDDNICAVFDITPAALARLKEKPGFQAIVAQTTDRVRQWAAMRERMAMSLDPQAFRVVEEVLLGLPSKERTQVAMEWLKMRMGTRAKVDGTITNNVNVITGDAVAQLTQALAGVREAQQRGATQTVVDLDADPHLSRA